MDNEPGAHVYMLRTAATTLDRRAKGWIDGLQNTVMEPMPATRRSGCRLSWSGLTIFLISLTQSLSNVRLRVGHEQRRRL
jgi:hypothetical protein